ncbi:MAG: hypothetical protein ACOC5D_01640 [Thermoplasmatota archaeon]
MFVFDASTLILLAKIELLGKLSEEIDIVIPETVKKEATAKKEAFDSKLIQSLINKGNIIIKPVDKSSTIKELMKDFNMHKGEASVLALFNEQKAELIATDDGQLIKAAKVMSIPFASSITFLIRSKQKGLIEKEIALEKLKKLEKYGWYKARIIEDAENRIRGG